MGWQYATASGEIELGLITATDELRSHTVFLLCRVSRILFSSNGAVDEFHAITVFCPHFLSYGIFASSKI